MILYELLNIIFCVLFANINAYWIGKNRRIYHGVNGAIHLVIAGAAWYCWGWIAFIIMLCNTRLIFDTLLNVFRGLPVDYVPLKPKSIVDKVEKFFFGMDGIKPKAIYFAISFGLNIALNILQ